MSDDDVFAIATTAFGSMKVTAKTMDQVDVIPNGNVTIEGVEYDLALSLYRLKGWDTVLPSDLHLSTTVPSGDFQGARDTVMSDLIPELRVWLNGDHGRHLFARAKVIQLGREAKEAGACVSRIEADLEQAKQAKATADRRMSAAIEAAHKMEKDEGEVQRHWLSWHEFEEDYRPINFPPNEAILGWWCSGSGEHGDKEYHTICAVVEAAGDPWKAVEIDWPGASEHQRFGDAVAADWTPGDRFPINDDWSIGRFHPETLEKSDGKP
jgi:hypothetical protein